MPSNGSSGQKEVTSVYVVNVDPKSTEGDVFNAFKNQSEGVAKARLLFDKDGNSKGVAFVDYHSAADAQKANASCQNIEVGGKKLYVQMARQI